MRLTRDLRRFRQGLLLRRAVDVGGHPGELPQLQLDDLPSGEQPRHGVAGRLVMRIVEAWREDSPIGDVEVDVCR